MKPFTSLLLLAAAAANTAGHISFKRSAEAGRDRMRAFLSWQVVGNLAGFAGVLAYTFVLRSMSLHVAFPLEQALTALGVQILASRLLFREHIAPLAWAGTALVMVGIAVMQV
jgi:multidrug transporter EmrE-like cation transporter